MIPYKNKLVFLVGVLFYFSVLANDEQWSMYNKNYSGTRFSTAAEINPENVGMLKEVCRIKLAKGGSFHTGPVIEGGLMYVTTTHVTFALDPVACNVVWRVIHIPDEKEVWRTNRGVAYMNKRVFRGTGDGRLIAMDALTGKVLWKVVSGDPKKGEFISSAPIASDGLVFSGTAGGDWGIRGRIMAFSAETGRLVWSFNTIPARGEAGFDTWPSEAIARTGGGGTWSSFALDEQSQELFVPVGNPAPDFAPSYRPGTNLFTDSLVVLDLKSGKLKWWYQLLPNDGHDLDLGAAPMLYRSQAGTAFVALAGKDGYVHIVDRSTHKLISRTPVTTITTPRPAPTLSGVAVCPGAFGGVEWNGPSFSNITDTMYVGSVDWCAVFKTGAVAHQPGELFSGGSYKQASTPPKGWITAINGSTGKIKWRYSADSAVVGGVTSTVTGVLFSGDLAGNFFALNTENGSVLLKKSLGGAIAGGVVTYTIKGRQFVAATAGNVSRTTFGMLGAPSIVIMAIEGNGPISPILVDASNFDSSPLGFDGEYKSRWRDRMASALASFVRIFADGIGLVQPARPRAAPPIANRGATLFAENCAVCHGQDQAGGVGPSLLHIDDRFLMSKAIGIIKKPNPPMPSLYPEILSDDDVSAIAHYLYKQ